jgi:ribokinase
MQLETPLDTVIAYARLARAAGVRVVLNAAPAQPLPPELLGLLDVLVVNQGELAQVAGCQGSVAQCLDRLQVPAVVVTLGGHGCCARVGPDTLVQAAFPVTPVDTTGAGDTFCGALVAALGRGDGLAGAMRQASAAGALACTRAGAQSSIPTRDEVMALLHTSQENTPAQQAAVRRFCGLP